MIATNHKKKKKDTNFCSAGMEVMEVMVVMMVTVVESDRIHHGFPLTLSQCKSDVRLIIKPADLIATWTLFGHEDKKRSKTIKK